MSKKIFDPDCRVAPVPVVVVSCAGEDAKGNLMTAAWAGNICSDPPMVYVSIRPERYSYELIKQSGEFVINLVNSDMLKGADRCGLYSGKSCDKWELSGFTPGECSAVSAPLIEESPLSIECKLTEIIELGSHDMFLGKVVAVDADEKYIDEYGRIRLNNAGLVSFINKSYVLADNFAEDMGFTLRKKKPTEHKKETPKKEK